MMRRERVTLLSERTRQEMAAGRKATGSVVDERAMLNAIHHSLVEATMKPLRKQFPSISGPVHIDWDMKDDPKNWMVEVHVQCGNGEWVAAPDPFVGFPSDELIATLMLLVG